MCSDVRKPLMGALQDQQGFTPLPANCPSQAIVDVSENMRAKLYSLFCKIGESAIRQLTCFKINLKACFAWCYAFGEE